MLAKRNGKIALTLLAVILLGGVVISTLPSSGGEWPSNVFEQEVEVTRIPDHENDRAPFNLEPVVLYISSRSDQVINAADVRYTWSYQGVQSTEGGYTFSKHNDTHWVTTIPGYQGGYTVQYHIDAFDEKNHPLTSATYSYKVVQNGSWQGDDFDLNLDLSWGPENPKEGESIFFNITTVDETVSINRADIFYTVSISGNPRDGVDSFFQVTATSVSYEMIPYPLGSSISFYIEAYDAYNGKIRSKTYYIEYPDIPIYGEIITGTLFAYIRDEGENKAADATVRFYNETFSYTTDTTAGWAMTNVTVNKGTYQVEIEYDGVFYDFVMNVPDRSGSFTTDFNVNPKSYAVMEENEDSPSWLEGLGVLLLIVMTIGSFMGARRLYDWRERLNKERKKARKRTDVKAEAWWEKLLLNSEKKNLVLRASAFLMLSLLGLFWAPFYPIWLILILGLFITAVSLRYPFISLLILAVLVAASTSYQSTEFGWVFLVFSLVVMIGGFFDWRYAYLTYLTIFATGLGVGLAVPLVAVVAISLFMGAVVLISAGVFLLVIAPSGNFNWYSWIPSEAHERSFVTFSRSAPSSWGPIDMVNALGDLTYVDTGVISNVLSETMGTLIPLVMLLGAGGALIGAYLILIRCEGGSVKKDPTPKDWAKRLIPGGILLIMGVITYLWADVEFTIWTAVAFLGFVPISLIPFGIRSLGEEALPMEYGIEEKKATAEVGKKISAMVGLQKTTFEDIGGLEDVKREIRNSLMVPLLEPEMATKYGVKPTKGILLFGPPGCGKTLMLKAVASDLNVEMIGVKCSDVMSKWYGESENLISSLFEEARARSPCILFLDEVDSIAKRRDFYSTDDVTPRVLSIMLSEMDGMDGAEGVIVVATTNMPDLVDPALMRPGRFDKVIYVPPPDKVSRGEILKVHIKGKFTEGEIDVDSVGRETRGFSGADIANLVRETSAVMMEKALETKKPQPITTDELLDMVKDIKPSVTPKMITAYDKLRAEFERKRRVSKADAPPSGEPDGGDGPEEVLDEVSDDVETELDEVVAPKKNGNDKEGPKKNGKMEKDPEDHDWEAE